MPRPKNDRIKMGMFTSVHFFKNEVKTIRLFKVLDQLDDVLVPLAMVKRLDLLEHPGPGTGLEALF